MGILNCCNPHDPWPNLPAATASPHRARHRGSSDAERQLAARGLAPVYDPTGGKLQGPVHPANGSSGGKVEAVKVKITDIAAFLMQQGPREGPIQCLITREKDTVVGMKNHK